jgi:hypothetical protein
MQGPSIAALCLAILVTLACDSGQSMEKSQTAEALAQATKQVQATARRRPPRVFSAKRIGAGASLEKRTPSAVP